MTYDEWYEYLRYCRAKSDYIAHHGILGQKWYRRRYQNADGSLTAEGKIRYNKYIDKETKRSDKYYNKQIKMDKRARHELARQKGHLSANPFKDRKQKLLLDDQIQLINRDIDSVSKVRDAARNKISNYTPENIEDEDRIRRASRLYNLGFGEREHLQRYRETGELPKYVQKQKDKEIKNKHHYNK